MKVCLLQFFVFTFEILSRIDMGLGAFSCIGILKIISLSVSVNSCLHCEITLDVSTKVF